jgi:hypothetical protein
VKWLKEFIKDILLPWFGIFLSIYLVYFTFKFQHSKQPLEKQLYKVYLPIFVKLEPFLYKKVSDIGIHTLSKLVNEIDDIVTEHYELVYPSIIHWCRWIKERLSKGEIDHERLESGYNYLCYLVDREFEKTRKGMFLPTRSRAYRLNNNQYRTKREMYYNLLILSMPQLIIFIFMFIVYMILA